jgi:hypothetical protein
MALIDCPECGHQVSDAAETCPSCGVRLSGQTAQLRLQLELSQIDLKWERERQGLMCHTRSGKPYVPTKRSAEVAAILSLVAGIGLGIFLASKAPGSGEFPCFAAFVIIVGLGVSYWYYTKAQAYEEAHAAYLKKKEAARLKYEGQADGPT